MTNQNTRTPPKSKTLKRTVLIALATIMLLSIVAAVVFVGLFASSSAIQQRLITAVASFKGYDITLAEGSHIKLWGDLDIKLEGLNVTPLAPTEQKASITLDAFTFKAPLLGFWQSYHFKDFTLKNLKVINPNGDELILEQGSIESELLSLNGQNNKHPFHLKLSLRNNASEGSETALYSLADQGAIDLLYQDIKAKTSYKLISSGKGVALSDINIGRTALSGTISINNILSPDQITLANLSAPNLAQFLHDAGITSSPVLSTQPDGPSIPFSLDGTLKLSSNAGIQGDFKSLSFGKSTGTASFKTATNGATFDLIMDQLVIEDAIALSGLNVKPADKKSAATALSGSINIKKGTFADQNVLSGLFTYEDDTKTQSFTTENAQLAQSDEFNLEALNAEDSGFAFKMNLRNAKLKDLIAISGNPTSAIKTGRADIDATLSAPAKIMTWTPFPSDITGKASVAFSDSDIDTKLVDRFVGGLINSLFPDAGDVNTTSLNCAFFPVNINEGVAVMEKGLIDTQRAQLMIEGDIGLSTETLDLLITPKPKGLALGDLSVPVYLTGPWSSPSLKPSTMGLGKKIGGLVLGMANPVFFAVALSDFSLPKDHPCTAIIADQPAESSTKETE